MITRDDIENWRCNNHMTKKELANLLGITYPYLVNVLRGKRALTPSTAAKFELLRGATQKTRSEHIRYDSIIAFSIRLTPAEYNKLCEISGAVGLSAEQAEMKVRELLQKTWDDLAQSVPQVVEEEEVERFMAADDSPRYDDAMDPFA